MSEPGATSGFEFYETLRYFLPGVLVVFLVDYLGILPCVASVSLGEKLAWGVLIGFLIHPLGMYKWIPGATRMRRDFRAKTERLLRGSADDYTRYDALFLIMTPEQRQHFRKYFALGAFKLDTAFVLCLFLVYYVAASLWFALSTGVFMFTPWIRALGAFKLDTAFVLCLFLVYRVAASLWFAVSTGVFMSAPWIRIVLVGSVAYFLKDDGLNDLGRAFNVALLRAVSLKKTGDLERTVRLLKDSEPYLVAGGRRMIDPPLSALPSLGSVLRRIKTRMPRRHK